MDKKKRAEKYPTVYIAKKESYNHDDTIIEIVVCNNFINTCYDYCQLYCEEKKITSDGSYALSKRVSDFFINYVNNIKSGLSLSEKQKLTIEFNDKLLGKLDFEEYEHFNKEKRRSSLIIPFYVDEARFFMRAFDAIKE